MRYWGAVVIFLILRFGEFRVFGGAQASHVAFHTALPRAVAQTAVPGFAQPVDEPVIEALP